MQLTKYLLCISLAVIGLSCRKHKNDKVCKNSFVAWQEVSADSVVLIEVDEMGKSMGSSPYPHVKTRFISYNKNDNCIYSIQWNDSTGKMYLYRFDIRNKKTDILTDTGTSLVKHKDGHWSFLYNNVADKFYIWYFDDFGTFNYESTLYEISISGNSFTTNYIEALDRYHPTVAPDLDELTGDLYFPIPLLRYTPSTHAVLELPTDKQIYAKLFNPNDGLFYGFNDIYGINGSTPVTIEFCKLDPKTGATSVISTFAVLFLDNVVSCTFDVCNNQYILQQGTSNVNIYGIDVKTGKIVKHVTTNESYTGLTYIPE